MCMLMITRVAGNPDRTLPDYNLDNPDRTLPDYNLGNPEQTLPDYNFELQRLPDVGRHCSGDTLKSLCDASQGIKCCLYKQGGSPDLSLDIEGGNGAFLRTLLPQLPADNITVLHLLHTDLSNQQDDSLCILSNLQSLFATKTHLGKFACLSQLQFIMLDSYDFVVTNTTFHGLKHLVTVVISEVLWSTDGLMPLQAAQELQYLYIRAHACRTQSIGHLATLPGKENPEDQGRFATQPI